MGVGWMLLWDVWKCIMCVLVFFFKQKTAYDRRISDWSSDVCSSDLVHRPRLIAPEAALLVGAAGRQEDDRNIARPLACAHEFGKLEAVHAGHLYVEQGERHIMLEEKLERLLPGSGLDRKCVWQGKSVSVRVDLGGRRIIRKKN